MGQTRCGGRQSRTSRLQPRRHNADRLALGPERPRFGYVDDGRTAPRAISKINENGPSDRAGVNRGERRPPPPRSPMTKKTHDVRKYLRPFIFDAPPLHSAGSTEFFSDVPPPTTSSRDVAQLLWPADTAARAMLRARSGDVVKGTG